MKKTQNFLAKMLDQLLKFNYKSATKNKLGGSKKFNSLFAGKQFVLIEFVIGVMFVIHVISAKDIFLDSILEIYLRFYY